LGERSGMPPAKEANLRLAGTTRGHAPLSNTFFYRAMQTYDLLIFRNSALFALWADLVRRAKKQ
jgi:hypothetical protein